MPKTYLKNSIVMALLLCSVMAFVLLPTTLKRGLFFREDYLPFLTRVAWLFALVSLIALLRGDSIWHGDVDILLAVIVGLYFLTNVWAQSKMDAMDGALKYAGYLMVFIMARYAAASGLGNRILRNMLVACGVVVAGAGYLTAAGIAEYPSSVAGGALLGSFQYPNALAAFAMFVLFFLYYAWYEGFRHSGLDLGAGVVYSACAFLLVGSVFLTNSRATLLMFGAFMALYGVLLPKGDRLKIMSRVTVSLLSFAVVASRMDTALKKSDAPAMKRGLAIGLALAVVLEIARWLVERRMAVVPKAALEVAGAATQANAAGASLKTVFTRVAIAGLVVVVASAALIAAVKNPATAGVLGKVLPERIVSQLKSLKLTDVSMLIRFMAAKDALSIALGYPLGTGAGGWEALYHQYHRTPYWFTETHNHFAQILVEVGFPGLLVYAVFWGLLAYAAIKAYFYILKCQTSDQAASVADRGAGETKRSSLAKLTSSAMAVFALGVHSALDFDLSLPAISVALFVSVAVLMADISGSPPSVASLMGPLKNHLAKAPSLKKGSKKGLAVAFPWAMAVTVLAAVALVTPVTLTAKRLYAGMAFASRGDQIMKTSGDLKLARKYIGEAMARDKWNASYPLELAEWAVDDFIKTRNPASQGMVPLYLKAARTAGPTSLDRQIMEFQMLRKVGFYDDSLRSLYEVVLMMPTNREYHQSLADLGRSVISQHLAGIVQPDLSESEREQHLHKLSASAEILTSAFNILNAKRERVTGIYAQVFNAKGLDFTPKIALAAGQVAFLRGEIESSGALLTAASKDKALAQEADAWLSYLVEATGYEATLPAGFLSNLEETHKMAALFGVISETR